MKGEQRMPQRSIFSQSAPKLEIILQCEYGSVLKLVELALLCV